MTNISGISLQTLIMGDYCKSNSQTPNEFVSRKFCGNGGKPSMHVTKLTDVIEQITGVCNMKCGLDLD